MENRKVNELLKKLVIIPWFAHVGEPCNDASIDQAGSWEEAWEALQDDAWTNASFHKDVDQSHPVWAKAYDIALAAAKESGHDHDLQEGIPVSLQAAWDAASAAYQIEVQDTDGFFIKLLEWYSKGHFPCGWRGVYPSGKLLVY